MCYAIPAKVTEIDGETAKVDYGGIFKTINISLVDSLSIGDYVLIHAGFAIEKLDLNHAKDALQIIEKEMQDIGIKI
jgi:hydrogenase expression/formation protein HypC